LLACHAGALATVAPVLMNPLLSRSISGGNQSVHGFAPIMEKTAEFEPPASPVFVFLSICSSFFPHLRISVW
jgi:hypothetical protein